MRREDWFRYVGRACDTESKYMHYNVILNIKITFRVIFNLTSLFSRYYFFCGKLEIVSNNRKGIGGNEINWNKLEQHNE